MAEAEDDDQWAPLEERDLPPAAAARLYQARLRAAQDELATAQAAVKARDAKLGGLEREAQQLRCAWGRLGAASQLCEWQQARQVQAARACPPPPAHPHRYLPFHAAA